MKSVELEKLRALCEELNLSEVSRAKVEETRSAFLKIEHHKPDVKTPQQQVKEFENLKLHAHNFLDALARLSYESSWALDSTLEKIGYSEVQLIYSGDFKAGRDVDASYTGFNSTINVQMDHVLEAVDSAIKLIGNKGKKGGRKSVLEEQIFYMHRMVTVLRKEDGIEPGRGGDFSKICNAVFEAAGVPSKAEGVIKAYMKKSGENVRRFLRALAAS